MGTSITGADSVRKEEPADIKTYVSNAHIGVFFDGTNQNMVREVFGYQFINFNDDDGTENTEKRSAKKISPKMLCDIEQRKGRSEGFTNVSMMFALFNGKNLPEGERYDKIYVEGAGTTDNVNNYRGSGFGRGMTGVTALVSKVAMKVNECVSSWSDVTPEKTTLHFYVFGFSRGAACARLFCHLLTRSCGSVLRCEDEFGKYRAKPMVRNGRLEFLEKYKRTENISVDFLGLYDTVASIGVLRRKDGSSFIQDVTASAGGAMVIDAMAENLLPSSEETYRDGELSGKRFGERLEGETFHYDNVDEYGLYTDSQIKNICHLCAMDEFRENFALVNLGRSVPANAVEVMIPGCHSDVGGSYLDGSKMSVIDKSGEDRGRKVSLNPYNEKPLDTADVTLSSFEELGWVDTEEKRDRRTTENDSQVRMYRYIDRGYSDIPLAMMTHYCLNMLKIELFQSVPIFHNYKSCRYPLLVNLGDEMVSKIEHLSKGERYWLFPTNYETLRLKYLHFSASGRVINAPNYDGNDVMCRITYHGDKGAQKTSAEGVHFLYELSGISKPVNSAPKVPVRPITGRALLARAGVRKHLSGAGGAKTI